MCIIVTEFSSSAIVPKGWGRGGGWGPLAPLDYNMLLFKNIYCATVTDNQSQYSVRAAIPKWGCGHAKVRVVVFAKCMQPSVSVEAHSEQEVDLVYCMLLGQS